MVSGNWLYLKRCFLPGFLTTWHDPNSTYILCCLLLQISPNSNSVKALTRVVLCSSNFHKPKFLRIERSLKRSLAPVLSLWSDKIFFHLTGSIWCPESLWLIPGFTVSKSPQTGFLPFLMHDNLLVILTLRQSQWKSKWVNHMIIGCFRFITHHKFF